MIIRQANDYRRPIQTSKVQRILPPRGTGREVIVLIDGVYNDKDHKAQSANKGERIFVAAGPYADSLIADGYVVAIEDTKEGRAPAGSQDDQPQDNGNQQPADSTQEQSSDGEQAPSAPHAFWIQAGITDGLAAALYAAGFTSVVGLLEVYDQQGLIPLIAIDGIGPKTAEKIVAWAMEKE